MKIPIRPSPVAFFFVASLFASCGGDDAGPPPGGSGAGGGGGASGAAGAGGGAGTAGAGGALGCERFAFVADGASCESTGCVSFECDCPERFPRSIAACTLDGCLVAADCKAVCGAPSILDAVDCTDTYTVAPTQGAGGAAGAGGSNGSAGSGMSATKCSQSDVRVPPASSTVLGNAPLVGRGLLADEAGALYVAGAVPSNAPIDLGGGELPAGRGLVVFKLDAAHNHVWGRRFGSEFGPDGVSTFSFAPNGDLLVGGVVGSKPDFGDGPGPASTGPQMYVARYDRDGNFLRSFVLPTGNPYPLPAGSIGLPNGDVWAFGDFNAPLNVGATTLTPAGDFDIFAIRYSADGNVLEAKRFGRSGRDNVFAATSGPDGGVYLVGHSQYAVDFGQSPVELGQNSSSWVVRLDGSLKPVWQKLVGGDGSYPRRALLDGAELVVAGDARRQAYYGDSATAGPLPEGNLFLLRIDASNGALLQGDAYAKDGFDAHVTALGRLPGGGAAVGGYVQPPADFGGGGLESAVGGRQPFVARYDGGGRHLWSTLFCSTNQVWDAVAGVANDGDSAVLLVPFDENLELGSGHFADFTGGLTTAFVDMPPD